MQNKKQQLELDMEQWTASKLGKDCIKTVYCQYILYIYTYTDNIYLYLLYIIYSIIDIYTDNIILNNIYVTYIFTGNIIHTHTHMYLMVSG